MAKTKARQVPNQGAEVAETQIAALEERKTKLLSDCGM
jgi:hypothetical protein